MRDELSFSRAAEKLLLSQPAISEQINALESELGFPLFRRAGRGVEVTAAGQIFLQEADEVLAGFRGLHDLSRQLRRGPTSRLSIGLAPGVMQPIIPLIAQAMQPMLSSVRLSITTAITPRLQRLITQQVLDLAISMQISPRTTDPTLVWDLVTLLEVALFVQPDHPLAAGRREATMADIAHEPLVVSEPSLGYGMLVRSMFSDYGQRPNIVAIADHTSMLKTMICSGFGSGILPVVTAQPELESGRLVKIALRPTRSMSLYIVRPAKALDDPVEDAIGRIHSVIRDVFGERPAA